MSIKDMCETIDDASDHLTFCYESLQQLASEPFGIKKLDTEFERLVVIADKLEALDTYIFRIRNIIKDIS